MAEKYFDKLTACLDMVGCPNRCKHCWLGHSANGNLGDDDLRFIANEFRPFAEKLEVASWYREPDYKDNYKELWKLESELSDERTTPHFENISFWRLVRDKEYCEWIRSLGVKTCQLTLFGGEDTTDLYYGRKGAFQELLKAFTILLDNKIVPRIQVFINQNNIDQLPFIEQLIEEQKLEERCFDIGREFEFFLHQGSCDGENEKFYDVWVTPSDLEKIPPKLAEYTLKHGNKTNIREIFGDTEQDLYKELITDTGTESYVTKSAVFYVDKDFNVYPNIETPAAYWCLGNLKKDGAAAVVDTYLHSKSIAQNARLYTPICDMVNACGDQDSQRLFLKSDYIFYILNQYCRQITG